MICSFIVGVNDLSYGDLRGLVKSVFKAHTKADAAVKEWLQKSHHFNTGDCAITQDYVDFIFRSGGNASAVPKYKEKDKKKATARVSFLKAIVLRMTEEAVSDY